MKKFGHWFTNVFWYHYKTHFIIGCFVLFLLISFTTTVLRNRQPDFQMVILTSDNVIFPDAPELSRLIKNEIGEVNGDGRVDVQVYVLSLSRANPNHYEHALQANIHLRDPSIVLYVVDDANRERFADFFEADDNPPDISQTTIFYEIGRYEQPYYAFFRMRTDNNNESDYRLAERVLQIIMESS